MTLLRTIVAMAMLALTATGACAHAVLTSSVPQDGSRLEVSPEELVLRFSEPVLPARMKLAGSGDLAIPELAEGEAENNVVRVPVPDRLEPGSYILSYSVTSVDGHPVAGSIAFGIGQASAGAPSPVVALNRAVAVGMRDGLHHAGAADERIVQRLIEPVHGRGRHVPFEQSEPVRGRVRPGRGAPWPESP